MTPIVSVIMPVFNTASFLPEAIESILGQTFGDIELVAVDDGSTDASREIVAFYARGDSRLRQILLERDGARIASGAHAANVGIAASGGEFIARMDSDDIALPRRLELQLALMRERDLDVCGGQAMKFGEREELLWYPESHEAIRSELVFRPAMMNSVMLVRGALMREARWSETDAFEEYEILTRLVFSARMGSTPELVHRFRQHDGSFSRVFRREMIDSTHVLRFRYFFKLFADATLEDFRAVNAVAASNSMADPRQLECAGGWLVRLSRVAEEKSRMRTLRRWNEACDLATVEPAELAPLREAFAARIAAPPG